MKKIKKCTNCKIYTMQDICPKCKNQTKIAHPPNFKFVKYLKYIQATNNYGNNN
ncbi:MAG: nucleolar RNA-binding Nop10p family protein [Candidatus Aenigmatarchaeota archaeon]